MAPSSSFSNRTGAVPKQNWRGFRWARLISAERHTRDLWRHDSCLSSLYTTINLSCINSIAIEVFSRSKMQKLPKYTCIKMNNGILGKIAFWTAAEFSRWRRSCNSIELNLICKSRWRLSMYYPEQLFWKNYWLLRNQPNTPVVPARRSA